MEVLPNTGKIDFVPNSSTLQQFPRPDATQLQNLWAMDRPRGKDNLFVRFHCDEFDFFITCFARSEQDARGFISIELDLGNLRIGDEVIICSIQTVPMTCS